MSIVRRIWVGWQELGRYVGDFQSRVLLTIFYFVVVPVFGLIARFQDPMSLRRSAPASGYRPRARDRGDLTSSRLQY